MANSFFQKLQSLFQSNTTDIAERFQIVREAVSGTMSSFHQAIDRRSGKTIGLKILDSEKTELFEARFRALKKPSEGQIAMLLKHPRIVETFEYGTAKDGRQFIVMEFVPGTGLNLLINNRSPILEGKSHLRSSSSGISTQAASK